MLWLRLGSAKLQSLSCRRHHCRIVRNHCVCTDRRHDPLQRKDPDRRQGFLDAAGAGDRRRQDPRHRHLGRDEEARRQGRKTDRPRRPHRDSRIDRRAHPRHPRRADLRHRGELDRRAHAEGRAGEDPPGGEGRRSPARGSSSPAAGPRSSLPRSAGRRRPKSRLPRPTIRSISSISTTGCCCRRRRWRR